MPGDDNHLSALLQWFSVQTDNIGGHFADVEDNRERPALFETGVAG
jgi:hypothetical protein